MIYFANEFTPIPSDGIMVGEASDLEFKPGYWPNCFEVQPENGPTVTFFYYGVKRQGLEIEYAQYRTDPTATYPEWTQAQLAGYVIHIYND